MPTAHTSGILLLYRIFGCVCICFVWMLKSYEIQLHTAITQESVRLTYIWRHRVSFSDEQRTQKIHSPIEKLKFQTPLSFCSIYKKKSFFLPYISWPNAFWAMELMDFEVIDRNKSTNKTMNSRGIENIQAGMLNATERRAKSRFVFVRCEKGFFFVCCSPFPYADGHH